MRPLSNIPLHESAFLSRVGGERSFRRRLMEMGFVPGTEVRIVNVAPLGDPLELEIRHSRISIRRREAEHLLVSP